MNLVLPFLKKVCFDNMIYTAVYNDKEIFGIFVETKKINCNVINNNSQTLCNNVPWSEVSRFKLRLKLKKGIFDI